MAFENLKSKITSVKDKALSYSAKKISNSSITIRDRESLIETIKKSKNTRYIDKKTDEIRYNKKRSIIIFGNEKSDFFQAALVDFPILATKAFSQNITIRLAVSKISGVDLKDYEVKKLPSLVIFDNEKVTKVISDKEKIQKLVKSFNLNINEMLENL